MGGGPSAVKATEPTNTAPMIRVTAESPIASMAGKRRMITELIAKQLAARRQAIRPNHSEAAPVATKLCCPNKTTTPKNPMRNPRRRRGVIRSPGIRKCDNGRKINATEAIETPANAEVTYC